MGMICIRLMVQIVALAAPKSSKLVTRECVSEVDKNNMRDLKEMCRMDYVQIGPSPTIMTGSDDEASKWVPDDTLVNEVIRKAYRELYKQEPCDRCIAAVSHPHSSPILIHR
jgi:hypothetical protein